MEHPVISLLAGVPSAAVHVARAVRNPDWRRTCRYLKKTKKTVLLQLTFVKVVKCWVLGWVVAANIVAQPRGGQVQIRISRGWAEKIFKYLENILIFRKIQVSSVITH